MRVAYLVNQYPKVSHSFIRREILALERSGLEIIRISLRGWNGVLKDEEDRSERQRTSFVLRDGALPLVAATVRSLFRRPYRFLSALALSLRMARGSDRPPWIHLIYLTEACRIEGWLRAAHVQHLHAHFGTNAAEVAMLVHELGGPRWSFTVHGPEEFDKTAGLSEKIRRCTFVIAISSFCRSQLFRLVDYEHWPKVEVVRCGIESHLYSEASFVAPSTRRLVCVGRLCEQKGQLLLVDAVHRLRERGIEIDLVLAGDGEMRSEIEALIGRYNLNSKVRVTGWISGNQVREEILAARALILPSFAEGLPVVIIEAMALRRPIISTFVAGIPELVKSEQGWLVPAGDVEALAHAMQACLNTSDETLKKMGDAARVRVLARHNVDDEAAKLSQLFRTAFKEKLPNSPL